MSGERDGVLVQNRFAERRNEPQRLTQQLA
jgi:hypothetical protein